MPAPGFLVGISAASGGLSVTNQVDFASRWLSQIGNNFVPNALIPFNFVVELRLRNLITDVQYNKLMRLYGIEKKDAQLIISGSAPLLTPQQLVDLHRRQLISTDEYKSWAKESNFDKAFLDRIYDSMQWFPTPQDLIRFAVREVYTPEIRSQYGLDEDFPSEFEDEARKVGITQEQAQNVWAAHWILPSVQQGFEMLHRHVIDFDQMQTLLRTHDIMPFWREALTKISYNPITRVDVRRMYRIGEITDHSELVERYEALGYNPDDAEKYARFTEKYENRDYAGITRANVTRAFILNIINETDFRIMLADMGFGEEAIDFFLSSALWEKTEDRIKLLKDEIIEAYRMGQVDADQIRIRLYKEDLPVEFVDSLIDDLLLKTSLKRKLPSKEDILRWLELRIIDEKQFYIRMSLLGYNEQDILFYLTEHNLDKSTKDRHFLNVKTYERWVKNGIMSLTEFAQMLHDKGVSKKDISFALQELSGGKNVRR